MHYFAVAIVPPTDDVDAAVGEVMRPDNEEVNDDGHWDWWVIGGRWTGVWGNLSPEDNPDNFERCFFCGGTGYRDDPTYLQFEPGNRCNGCQHTGRPGLRLKHPAEWVRDPADIRPAADVLADSGARTPYAFVTIEAWHASQRWTGDIIEDVEGYEEAYRAVLAANPDDLAVVVDYHS